MIRYFLSFLLLTFLVHAKDTCYTIQVISTDNNAKNKSFLESNEYDASCKIMAIGSQLTVRCGCFEQYKESQPLLKKIKKEHKHSFVTTTYKYRFATQEATKPQPKESVQSLITNISETIEVDEAIKEPIVEKSEKVTKKTKTKNKKKKEKKKKVKLVKKRAQTYSYQRYLRPFKSTRGTGPYDYRYKFGAELSYDLGYIDQSPAKNFNDPQPYFDHKWRRVRVNHSGSFFDQRLFYELEYSFTGNSNFKDVYIAYQDKLPWEDTSYRVRAGNLKVPFSLSRYSASKNLSFMERPLGDDPFSLRRKLGAEAKINTKSGKNNIGAFVSVFANSIDENRNGDGSKPGATLRLIYTYKAAKRELLHLGVASLMQDYNNEDLHYQQAAESRLINNKYVSTRIKNTNNVQNNYVDLLYLYHNYYFLANYTTSRVKADKDTYNFNSYSVEGSYFLIGEGKRFKVKDGKFSKMKINKDGALEFAMRYSYIDLNDKSEQGGEEDDYNFALNWYINQEIKVMMNYIMAYPKGTDDYDGLINIYQMRLFFAF